MVVLHPKRERERERERERGETETETECCTELMGSTVGSVAECRRGGLLVLQDVEGERVVM